MLHLEDDLKNHLRKTANGGSMNARVRVLLMADKALSETKWWPAIVAVGVEEYLKSRGTLNEGTG